MFRFSLYLQQFNVFSRLSATISPIIRCESKGISHIMQANFVNASIHFAVVLPLLHNDDAKQMQIESRTCQACLGNYAEMQLCLSKVCTIHLHALIRFVFSPHWFVNAAFCTFQHPTTVKNTRQILTFLPKLLHNSNKSRTFVPPEPPSLLTMLKSGVVLFLYHNEIIVRQVFYAA